MTGRRSIWREPVAWLALGLPLVAIAAAIVTIVLALRDPADASGSATRRIAQMQLEDLAPDREAARRALRADVEVDAAGGAVRVRLQPDDGSPGSLQLALRHPLRAALDRRVELRRVDGAWHGHTQAWSAMQAWDVQLDDSQAGWRLRGRLTAANPHATLLPQAPR